MKTKAVIVEDKDSRYMGAPPFDPEEIYPEYPYSEDGISQKNDIYRMVRELFFSMGFDLNNYGSNDWNPLGEMMSPGDNVVIKTNFVTSMDRHIHLMGDFLYCITVHGSVIRPIVDYSFKAVGDKGKISIVDSPIEGNNFDETVRLLGVSDMVEHLRNEHNLPLELIDLRDFRVKPIMFIDSFHLFGRSINIGFFHRKTLSGDPMGYTVVDLKKDSKLYEIADKSSSFRFYKPHLKDPVKYHNEERNEYSIANTVLNADVIINVPKLKTHKKTGVTLCLKSVIGISNRKNWLPHYIAGVPPYGDEYPMLPSFKQKISQFFKIVSLFRGNSLIFRAPKIKGDMHQVTEGSWYGNDTLWRVILDLNAILFYADKKGKMQTKKQRKYLTIIDGIFGGEGEGPLAATPKKCGLLIGSFDPVAADAVATRIMGFDEKKIKYIDKISEFEKYSLGVSKIEGIEVVPDKIKDINLKFEPPINWKHYLER